MGKNEYFNAWRRKHKSLWSYQQLKWYYKNRKRILKGWQKPSSPEADEADKWAARFG